MKDVIQLLGALSDETRLRLVKALLTGEWCVCELADALEVEQSNLSRHLAVLRQAGLLRDRKEGTWVYYAVALERRPQVTSILAALGEPDSPRCERDRERLRQRLALRTDGRCLLGYGQLD